jgi:hypothetical protein
MHRTHRCICICLNNLWLQNEVDDGEQKHHQCTYILMIIFIDKYNRYIYDKARKKWYSMVVIEWIYWCRMSANYFLRFSHTVRTHIDRSKHTNELFLSVHHQTNTSTTRDRISFGKQNSFELVFVLCWYKSVAAECCSSDCLIFFVPTRVSICLIRSYIDDELFKTLEIC